MSTTEIDTDNERNWITAFTYWNQNNREVDENVIYWRLQHSLNGCYMKMFTAPLKQHLISIFINAV